MSDAAPRYTIEAQRQPITDFRLVGYLMHIHTQRCGSCSTEHQWSVLNSQFVHRTNRSLLRTTPLDSGALLSEGIPVVISKLPTKRVPVCHECYDTYNSEHSNAPSRIVDESRWRETLLRKAEQDRREEAERKKREAALAAPRSPTRASIDDL